MFELPKNKGRAQPLGRKSVTGSSTDITSPKKAETERIRIAASRDDSSMGEFQSRSVSPRKVCSLFKCFSWITFVLFTDVHCNTDSL